MALLKIFAIVTSLAANFAAVKTCHSDPLKPWPTIWTDCMQSVGISAEEAMKFVPNEDGLIDINTEDLKGTCRKQDLYLQAGECFLNYRSRMICADQWDYYKLLYGVVHFVAKQCDDHKLKLECLSALFRDTHDLAACVEKKKEGRRFPENTSFPNMQIQWDFYDCCFQSLEVCDAYTAERFNALAYIRSGEGGIKLNLPRLM